MYWNEIRPHDPDWEKHKEEYPPPRRGHSTWVYRRKLYIAGGYSFRSHFLFGVVHMIHQDVWKYSLDKKKWKKCDFTLPIPLDGQTCSIVPSKDGRSDMLYMYGGNTYDDQGQFTCSPFTFALNLDTREWTLVSPTKENPMIPRPRVWHASCVVGRKIYIIAGRDANLEYFNDTWVFDTDTAQWSLLDTKGDVPSPRAAASACVVGTKIYLFGGRYRNFPPDVDDYPPVQGKPSHSHYNDIFVLDTETLEWKKLNPEGDIPSPRSCQTFIIHPLDPKKLLLIGGYTCADMVFNYFNDCYVYDTEANRWTTLEFIGDKPMWLSLNYGSCFGRTIYLFGGEGGKPVYHTHTQYLNSFYTLTVGALYFMARRWFYFNTRVAAPPKTFRGTSHLFHTGEFHDVTIHHNNESWPAHKAILQARCPALMRFFSDGHIKVHFENNVPELDVSAKVFRSFLEYIYTGNITDPWEYTTDEILQLLHCALTLPVRGLVATTLRLLDDFIEPTHPKSSLIAVLNEIAKLAGHQRLLDYCQLAMEGKIISLKSIIDSTDQSSVEDDLLSLYVSQEHCDLTLQADEHNFIVHKCIVASRIPYLSLLLRSGLKESQHSVIRFSGHDGTLLPAPVVECILRHCYGGPSSRVFEVDCGQYPSAHLSFHNALLLLQNADYLGLTDVHDQPLLDLTIEVILRELGKGPSQCVEIMKIAWNLGQDDLLQHAYSALMQYDSNIVNSLLKDLPASLSQQLDKMKNK